MGYPQFNERNEGKIIAMPANKREKEDKAEQILIKLERVGCDCENLTKTIDEFKKDTKNNFEKFGERVDTLETGVGEIKGDIKVLKNTNKFFKLIGCGIIGFGIMFVKWSHEKITDLMTPATSVVSTVEGSFINADNLDELLVFEKVISRPLLLSCPSDVMNAMDDTLVVSDSHLDADTYVGEDRNGKKYTATDIVGRAVLLSYQDGDYMVYFLGKFNENYHWDGFCVMNAYCEDGTLFGVCEADFKDGVRNTYESLYRSNDGKEWIHTQRTYSELGNAGTTDKYLYTYDVKKEFVKDDIEVSDIKYIKYLLNEYSGSPSSHYNGLTSNGYYNDQTGKAYRITYNNNGIIQMLYIGQFMDGQFNDKTGNALQIVWDDSVKPGRYFYYKGTFTDGVRDGKVSAKDYVTQEQINDILAGMEFDCELKWQKTE